MTDELQPGEPSWPTPRTDGTDPASAFRVPFSIGIGLSLVIWTVVSQLVVAVVFATLGIDFNGPVELRILVVVSQLVTLGGALMAMRATGRLSWRILGPTRPAPVHLLTGIGAGLGGYALVIAWVLLWTAAFGEPAPIEQALLQEVGSSVAVVVLSFLVAAMMAPLVEEFVFRGVLFQALRRQLGLWPGIVLSSLVFTLVHVELYPPAGDFQPVGLGGLLLLGGWFAWAFHRTGSLAVPIVGHSVFNAINLTLAIATTGA